MFETVNWLAVAVAALATFVIGGPWYSPALFRNRWQREMGVADMKPGHPLRVFGLAYRHSLSRGSTRTGGGRSFRTQSGRDCGRLFRCHELRGQLSVRKPQLRCSAYRWRLSHRAVRRVRVGARRLAGMSRKQLRQFALSAIQFPLRQDPSQPFIQACRAELRELGVAA